MSEQVFSSELEATATQQAAVVELVVSEPAVIDIIGSGLTGPPGPAGSRYSAGPGLVISEEDVIDVSPTYSGQDSIDTLGTVTTGTWEGDTIALDQGGTGATTQVDARVNLAATGKYAVTLGELTAGVETVITHNLNTMDVIAMFRDATTNSQILLNWRPITADTAGVTADVSYGSSTIRAVVIG